MADVCLLCKSAFRAYFRKKGQAQINWKRHYFFLSAPDFRTALGTARYSQQVWGAVNPTVGVCEWNPQNISEISTILNIQKQDFPSYHGG